MLPGTEHVLAPDGDLILLLKPTEELPQSQTQIQIVVQPPADIHIESSNDELGLVTVGLGSVVIQASDASEQGSGSPEASGHDSTTEPPPQAEAEPEQEPCPIKVSSGTLAAVSPVFCRMFRAGFKEGNQLKRGCLELALPDDHADASLTLVQVIHCKFRQVSRKMDLSRLTEIALLIDKYDCLEATETLSGE